MNWAVVPPILPLLFIGVRVTVTITLLSVLTGLIIGTFVGMARLAKSPLLYWPATFYVEVIRGTPLLVQLVLVYYALPQAIGVNLPPMLAGWLAFSINSGAYVSEIVRAGIQSIDRGQTEAARSLGMTFAQAMRYIILPQAFRNIMPALGNEFITLLKDSALMSTIAVPELMRYGQMMVGRKAEPFPIYITVGAIYLALTLPLSLIVRRMERRLTKGDRA
ncbi:MAG: polar amino acid transport system permease protein [Bacillota bacterium]|nr:polar amino acid transport system permease protein [Bacillota bacterium]MDK2925316.1 polar amino acid transport system permease protein [Bacillota bacterium]